MADGHLFNSISLGGRGGTNAGQLRIHSGGILWKKSGGGKAVEVDKADVVGLTWMKVPRSNQLGVRIKDGLYYKFTGFRDQDVATVTSFLQSSCGITPEEKQLSVSGKNWGEVDLNGNMLTFLVGSKQAFEVSLADVSQTQLQGKNDVILEFHVDDTTGANEKDSLMEISFHIPNSNTQFVGDENRPSAQVFRDKIMSMADVGAGGEESVVTFEGIAILTPRGRYNVELHLSFLRLQGQANDFKIQYSSVVRLFLLPKSNQPHTFVVVTLDPPIRKGQTLYPHIVLQFETDYVVESTLSMNEDLLNSKYKDKLEPPYKGLIHEVFILIMRGLSGAKVTRPGKFRSCQDGYAVKSSLKTEDGVLYPLEKGFFFLHKPPTLILHEENAWNEAFHSGRHTEAVEHYTAMVSSNIKSRPFAAICFCNCAAAHQSLGQIADAIADCSLAIVLDESYSKAVSRRATFHETIRDYEQAASDLHILISLLEKQSQEKVQQCGSGGNVKELRQARRHVSSVEEKAKNGL